MAEPCEVASFSFIPSLKYDRSCDQHDLPWCVPKFELKNSANFSLRQIILTLRVRVYTLPSIIMEVKNRSVQ